MDLAFAAGYLKNLLTIQKWRQYKKEFEPKRLPSGMYRCKRFTFNKLKEARRFCKEYSAYLAIKKIYVGSPREIGNYLHPNMVRDWLQQRCPDIFVERIERLSSKGMCAAYTSEVVEQRSNRSIRHTVFRDSFNRLQLIIIYHKHSQFMKISYSAALITEAELFHQINDALLDISVKYKQQNRSMNETAANLRRNGSGIRYPRYMLDTIFTGMLTGNYNIDRNNNSDSD